MKLKQPIWPSYNMYMSYMYMYMYMYSPPWATKAEDHLHSGRRV